jgi:hypothetical protein
MSNKNTALFAASLLAASGAIAVDYVTSDAPSAVAAQEETYNPCAAAPAPVAGQRDYDAIADDYSGSGSAPAAAPAPAPAPADSNPCSAGVL